MTTKASDLSGLLNKQASQARGVEQKLTLTTLEHGCWLTAGAGSLSTIPLLRQVIN